MLIWSRDDLAKAARVAPRTIVDFERSMRRTYERTVRDLQAAFEAAGLIFIEDETGCGVLDTRAETRTTVKPGRRRPRRRS